MDYIVNSMIDALQPDCLLDSLNKCLLVNKNIL